MTTSAYTLQRAQQINGVKDVAEDYVVELLVEFQSFRIAAKKSKMRIYFASDLDHLVANLDTQTVGWLYGIEKMPCCTADLQHTLSRFNDVTQETFYSVVVILVSLNEVLSARGMIVQLFSTRLSTKAKRVEPPRPRRTCGFHRVFQMRFFHDVTHFPPIRPLLPPINDEIADL